MKIVQATGQTCNQFWIYSNFLADAIEKKEKFAIWVPDIAFEYFPNILNSDFIFYPLYSKRLANFFGYKSYVKALKTIFSNNVTLKLFKIIIDKLPGQSFLIADIGLNNSIHKHKYSEQLLALHIPKENVVSKVANFMKTIRKDYEIIIGVHIRYGDYRTYENGKYFYSLIEYASFFKNISEIFDEQKIAFFITSNEVIDTRFFTDYKCFYLPDSSMAEDLYSLSKTDYILGPPSTFSAWASLYENTPLYFIESAKTDFNKADFINIKDIWF